ncbi:MAG TPA: DUF6152 family protein [Gammaproteobacteria bacterium]|nr:DUF6152 family protein [Gammaproteobacteria bacterium]
MRVSMWFGVLGGAALIAVAAPVVAHHSFAAEFDINRPIKLDGVVTKMEFSNPHSWLHIEVVTDTGEKQQWMVEGGAPNALIRNGWTRNSVPPGIKVHVEGFQAKDRSFRASGRDITLPDGKSLFMGQGGAAAPSAD